jgi:hypothetical protein
MTTFVLSEPWTRFELTTLVVIGQKYECLSRLVSNARYIRYRNIEPLNIEWCLTWGTIWCALLFTIFKFVPRTKNWAALPLINTYFLLASENVDNNIHPPPPLKSAFEVLMTRQNLCNKVPVKFRFTGEFFFVRVLLWDCLFQEQKIGQHFP